MKFGGVILAKCQGFGPNISRTCEVLQLLGHVVDFFTVGGRRDARDEAELRKGKLS